MTKVEKVTLLARYYERESGRYIGENIHILEENKCLNDFINYYSHALRTKKLPSFPYQEQDTNNILVHLEFVFWCFDGDWKIE